MRMDKLTSKFQMAIADAQSLAVGRDNQYIEPIHLMAALMDQEGGSVRPILAQSGANVAALRSNLDAALDRLPTVEGAAGEVHLSNDLNRLLNVTDKLAQKRNDQYISSELFLLAAVDDKDTLGDLCARLERFAVRLKKPSMMYAVVKVSMTPMPKNSARHWRNTPLI